MKDDLRGAVAQMGERMTGSHEVRGSIPLSSTSKKKDLWRIAVSPLCFDALQFRFWFTLIQSHTVLIPPLRPSTLS